MKTEGWAVMGIQRREQLLPAAVVLLVTAILIPQSSAGQTAPEDVVRLRNEAAQEAVDAAGDPVSDETREALKDVINGLIDFQELSRRALRRHWAQRTPEEQAQFVDVFRQLIRTSSVQKLEIYSADSITYQPAEIDGDRSRVMTIAHKGRNSVEILYLMHKVGDEWRAYDVVVDDSSTLRTYQDSFQREINSTSYEAMYNRMVDKLAESGS